MKNTILFILLVTLLVGCKKTGKNSKNEISIHLLGDPDKLLPYSSNTADATYIEHLIFQKLIEWDYEKNEFVGKLAKQRPKITFITSGEYAGGMKLDYEIRPEATWDNGTPITGYDVAFTYKAVLNPKTACEHKRPYYKFLSNIIVDSLNPKKFTVYSKEKYVLAEEYSGYWVLPEYIYDKEKIMRNFSIKELKNEKDTNSLFKNNNIIKFADDFNSQKYSRELGYVVGSGAYEFSNWTTGSKLILKLKKNWWGRTSNDSTIRNYGHIETVKYSIINDWSTASTAIKGKELDCINGIEFKLFNELKTDENFNKSFNAYTPTMQSYVFIGINLSKEKFKDLKVRQALAHTLDKNQIIQTLLYGLATPVESMISPEKKEYNKNLKSYEFDIAKANSLLDEAGWKDTDGDGIRDKIIQGKKTDLNIEYKYNTGNITRKNIGLIYKENLNKIGVELTIVNKEFTVFLDDLKKHDFELFCGSWVGDPNIEDQTEIFHTKSSNGGSNYSSYGDPISDKMIESIRTELNESKRTEIYQKLQEKVHNDIPRIFIYSPLERMAFSKRFTNTNAYKVRPGYDIGLWKLAK